MIVCKLCESVIIGETTVGNLIREGDILRRESVRDETKLMQAMEKYHAAWSALRKNCESHAECIKSVDKDYEDVYRIIQRSRA